MNNNIKKINEKINVINEEINVINEEINNVNEKVIINEGIIKKVQKDRMQTMVIPVLSLVATVAIGLYTLFLQKQYNGLVIEQNERDGEQMEQQRKANMPKFAVSYQIHEKKYTINEKEYAPGIECTIKNVGGVMTNLVIYPYHYYTIRVQFWDENEKSDNDSIISLDKNNSKIFNIQTDGLIISEMPYYNVKENEFKINLIEREEIDSIFTNLLEKLHKNVRNNLIMDETFCFEIEYLDFYGEYHKECYALSRSQVKGIVQPNVGIRMAKVDPSNIEDTYINIMNEMKIEDINDIVKLQEK